MISVSREITDSSCVLVISLSMLFWTGKGLSCIFSNLFRKIYEIRQRGRFIDRCSGSGKDNQLIITSKRIVTHTCVKANGSNAFNALEPC